MISIIVPIYNEENYLQKCLSSIQNQTYKNFEVLMIINGCTDNSKYICEKFTSDIRFKLFESEKGVSKARNLGLSKMKGDIVCFIDADDYIENDYLQEIYDAFNTHNVDILCRPKYINSNLIPGNEYQFSKLNFMFDTGYTHKNIYKASLIKDIRFNENLDMYEDTLFGMEAYYKADRFYILKNNKYIRVKNPNGLMHSVSWKDNLNILRNLFINLYSKYQSDTLKTQINYFLLSPNQKKFGLKTI